jgi:hypothetical protein
MLAAIKHILTATCRHFSSKVGHPSRKLTLNKTRGVTLASCQQLSWGDAVGTKLSYNSDVYFLVLLERFGVFVPANLPAGTVLAARPHTMEAPRTGG